MSLVSAPQWLVSETRADLLPGDEYCGTVVTSQETLHGPEADALVPVTISLTSNCTVCSHHPPGSSGTCMTQTPLHKHGWTQQTCHAWGSCICSRYRSHASLGQTSNVAWSLLEARNTHFRDVSIPRTCHGTCPRTYSSDSLHACIGQVPSSQQQPDWMGTYDTRRPKYLTKPSEGTHNEGFDNDNHDLIVYIDMVIDAPAPTTRCGLPDASSCSWCTSVLLSHTLGV